METFYVLVILNYIKYQYQVAISKIDTIKDFEHSHYWEMYKHGICRFLSRNTPFDRWEDSEVIDYIQWYIVGLIESTNSLQGNGYLCETISKLISPSKSEEFVVPLKKRIKFIDNTISKIKESGLPSIIDEENGFIFGYLREMSFFYLLVILRREIIAYRQDLDGKTSNFRIIPNSTFKHYNLTEKYYEEILTQFDIDTFLSVDLNINMLCLDLLNYQFSFGDIVPDLLPEKYQQQHKLSCLNQFFKNLSKKNNLYQDILTV